MSQSLKAADPKQVEALLRKKYTNPVTELAFKTPYELVCSVIMAAMCTDKLVNKVTPAFFKRYPDAKALAKADIEEIKEYIKSVNFFNNKAKSLKGMAITLLEKFNGEMPKTIAELMQLPGVARKSANVILNEVYNIAEGFVVDTHIGRVSQRLGFTKEKNPVKIEQDLMKTFPQKSWRYLSSAMVLHGRYTCTARSPKCSECVLNKICPSAFKV